MKHASIIPLIGGETIGSERAFGERPSYIMSYSPFRANDEHVLNYYDYEVPYHVLDEGSHGKMPNVDVVSSVCPCAGLSTMSAGFGDENQNNKWMLETTRFVLQEVRPRVLWGENAPGFAGKIGKTIREQMRAIAIDAGYSMSVYRTRSLFHGVPQVRERSFYFFWQGERVPLLKYFRKEYPRIEGLILSSTGNTQREPINPKTPSNDPYYRFLLEHDEGGISHLEFMARLTDEEGRGTEAMSLIQRRGYDWRQVSEWFDSKGLAREAASAIRKAEKIASGGNIMKRGVVFPKDYIGAFVGFYATSLTHPIEDRFVSYREAMTIMGLPENFELLNPTKSYNHICQNVPVQTAQDMASEVRAALLDQREWIDSRHVFQYNHTQQHVVADERTRTIMEFMS